MVILPRIPPRVLARAASLVCVLVLAPFASAASQETEEAPGFCTVGRPQPSCERLLVAQFTFYPRIERSSELDAPYEWEIGLLVNRSPTHAAGATVVLGMDGEGIRTAIKGRYRRWLGRYAALDASGGMAYARRDQAGPFETDPAFGVTGDLAVGLTDLVSVGVRADLMWSGLDRGPAGATYGAVRLGTYPGIVAGILALVVFSAVAGAG